MSKNKAKITIFGSTYFLVTNQTEDHLYQAAAYVDQIMKNLQHSVDEPSKIAVLTALQLASKLLLLEQEQNYAMLEQKRLMEKMNSRV